MHIIQIEALYNGAHNNQNGELDVCPEGYAIIPDDMEIPDTYPFVDIEVENGIVTKMTAGVMPEPEPEPEPEPSEIELLTARIEALEALLLASQKEEEKEES
jgi:hypothetical protein